MSDTFFERPIINSPYAYPGKHWELDEQGQPTGRLVDERRRATFFTPIPKPKKRKGSAKQGDLTFGEDGTTSRERQQHLDTINELRGLVADWRKLPSGQWMVTPETARLLHHWRHHEFSRERPFFCQLEAAETAIWLTEVAPNLPAGKRLLAYLEAANEAANPGLRRMALKLATGAGKTTV
ncbi:MAG: restriction endonuclease, partial [Planctomycetia bacterium]